MTSRSDSVRSVIRVNATSIDVTSSDKITFGYVNELARAGRVIGGRHRLHSPLPTPSGKKPSNAGSSLWRADSLRPSIGVAGPPGAASANPAPPSSPVLVELLDPAIAEDPALADLFEAECRAAAAVASPFVSRVLDFGIEASTPYLVTELGTGETLATRIASRSAARQRASHGEVAQLVDELGQALDALHGAGVLHRDLQSARVQLVQASAAGSSEPARRGGEWQGVKLSFGISKLMNDTLELVRTMAHRAVGPAESPQYASPEQILATSPLSPQSDLWSLAVMAFECMTGEHPFDGATLGDRLVQICAGSARVPSEVCEVPSGFDAWFARGVRKAARERWGSGREMSDALGSLLGFGP